MLMIAAADPVTRHIPALRLAIIGFDWYVLFQRFQHLAVALAQHHRVVYWCSRDSWWKLAGQRVRGVEVVPVRIPLRLGRNLVLLSIPKLLPGRLLLRMPNLDALSTYFQTRWLADFPGGTAYDAVILAEPKAAAARLWERVPARMRIYDCFDENAHFFPTGSREYHQALALERWVLRRAEIVLASSEPLFRRLKSCHKRVVLVPNGVEVTQFAADRELPIPDELRSITKPILGYVGALARWVDIGLIARLAELLPDYQLVLVGPAETDVRELASRPNILLCGRKRYQELPAYVQRFDIGMIPFRDNELTRAVDPVKFYEYCAAGKPVVATPLPALVARPGLVEIATSPTEFAERVRQAHRTDTPELRARRIQFARENSWQARAEMIIRAIESRQ